MEAVEVKNGIYWVGAIDWAVRDFHGYETPRGTSYNNYLILDEQPTLVDTVKCDFADVSLKNIKNLTDLSQIKHVVINHIENDHASAFDLFMDLMPQATVYMTERARKGLERFFDLSKRTIKTVKSGETLSIGKKTLLFLETPMLHWPDSMVTYIKEDKVLLSQDAFGQHIASSARFDDEFVACQSLAELEDAVLDYYANILMPFGSLVKGKIAEIQKAGLEIDVIAPDHGIIWRTNPGMILTRYLEMAEGKAVESVSIVYDTMWHSTERMAQPIAKGITDEGLECRIMKLRATPMSVAVKEFWRSRGTLVGSPTMNNILFPTVAQFLAYLRGLRPKNRIVGAFGSFGWSGGAVKEIQEEFKRIGLETLENGLQVQFRPSEEDEEKCYEFGRAFARQVRSYHASLERS
ncbi:MAG TPA: MBL fold metallo-hydrolase [Deltaproteobacteria bacterium]|nr:MBL fold metallo-hydrolase [Deltaproteobacteria bacterium]